MFGTQYAHPRFALLFLSAFRDSIAAEQFIHQCPQADETVSDGYYVYPAIIRERYKGQAKHRFCVKFKDKKNNNLAERLQNTLRRFLHPRRGFNSLQTTGTQLTGLWIYYNFLRTVKQRLQFLIQQATLSWLHILTRPLPSRQP